MCLHLAVIGYRVWSSNRLLKKTGVLEHGRDILVCFTRLFLEHGSLCPSLLIIGQHSNTCGERCSVDVCHSFLLPVFSLPTSPSTWVILYLIWYLTGSELEALGSATAPVVIGITFVLINLRVGLGLGQETRDTTTGLQWAKTPFSSTSARCTSCGEDIQRPQAISLPARHPSRQVETAVIVEEVTGEGIKTMNSPRQRSGDAFGGDV